MEEKISQDYDNVRALQIKIQLRETQIKNEN